MKLDELFPKDRDEKINGRKHVVHEDGTYLIVAAWANPLHMRALTRVRRGREKKIDAGRLGLDEEDRLACQAMAEGILRGWGGPDTEPFTEELAEQHLFERLHLRAKVIELSQADAEARTDEEDDAGKD